MSRVCRITPRASRDIEAIADYIAAQSTLEIAEQFLNDIDIIFQRLSQFPQMGRKRDELYPNLRSFPYKKYLVFYRLLNDEIEVFRIVSGYQDLNSLFDK
ncbi:MAG: type II toxin-antitoxin system RelE/ParE family toxin [Spirulina sp. SIO3F2]|nr:type II toxin-antitoxin system RelE/ParE family toxin [Spirulina sp. SIO3F2]